MALTKQTMTNEQRKSVAIEYLKAFDNGGVTSDGGSILDLFASDAQVYFPKWGVAQRQRADRQAVRRRRRHDQVDRPSLFAISTGSSRARISSSPKAPAMASIGTAPGAPTFPNMAQAAGATCSKSATGRFSALHLSRPRLRGQRTRRAIRG